MEPLLRACETGTDLWVRVTPRAARSAIAGQVALADGRPALAVRLAAPPVDGAANSALVQLLADQLRLKRTAIRIIAGETARLKRLWLPVPPEELEKKLAVLGIQP